MTMRTITRTILLLVALTPIVGAAQRVQPADATDREAIARVRFLSAPLRFRDNDPADKARYYAQMKDATDRLRGEIDSFVQTAIQPTDGSARVQARLRTVLAEHKPHPDYSDLPLAREADLRAGRSLVVAYTIVRPPHHDSATIRGYLGMYGRFDLVATTAEEDFDGFGMFKEELTSPLFGEHWLLAWGRSHTYNGAKMRFRVYAFDGQTFRTVWAPEDMFNATVRLTTSGFAIDHDVQEAPYQRHDEYILTPDGPVKTM